MIMYNNIPKITTQPDMDIDVKFSKMKIILNMDFILSIYVRTY